MPDFTLRPVRVDDAEQVISYMKTLADEPNNGTTYSYADEFKYTPEEERKVLQGYIESPVRVWIVAEADGQIVGMVNATEGVRCYNHTLTFGISVAKAWREQGVGSAMLRELIDWCKGNPLVTRLQLGVYTNNPRAIHVYEKLGFEREGISRRACFKHGEYLDSLQMAMLFER